MSMLSTFPWHVYNQPALVVQWQKLMKRNDVWKAQNPADHALTSRSCLFLLQIFELAPIEGGGLIIAVVSTIHVTIHIIVSLLWIATDFLNQTLLSKFPKCLCTLYMKKCKAGTYFLKHETISEYWKNSCRPTASQWYFVRVESPLC